VVSLVPLLLSRDREGSVFCHVGQAILPAAAFQAAPGLPAVPPGHRPALVILSCLVMAIALPAQTPPGVIHVETREVVVDVTVTDSKNVPVQDLEKQDFTVLDEGKPRVIDAFSIVHSEPPITGMPSTSPLHLPVASSSERTSATSHSTAIILDEVNTYFEDSATSRQYVIDVMSKVPPDERIALYCIVRKQGLILLQDYTTDRDLLRRTLAKHVPSGLLPAPSQPPHFYVDQPIPPSNVRPMDPKPMDPKEFVLIWRENANAARLSLDALAEQLAPVPGRKSLFWVTTGFHPWILGLGKAPPGDSPLSALNMEKPAWEKTFTALNDADVAVNVVDSRGLYAASDQFNGTDAVMEVVAEKTGGTAYYGRNDLDGAIAEGIAASRTTYSLRFHLANEERDNRFHALKVIVDRPRLQLHYRQGYYAGGAQTRVDLVAGKIEGQMLEARASGAEAATLDAAVQLPYFYTGTNRANVHLSVDVVPAGIVFEKNATGLHGKIELVGIALRPDGGEAARFADTVNVDVEDQKQADSFTRTPYHYEHQFAVASGMYIFRLAMGAGPTAGKKEVALNVEPWSSTNLGIGGIALSTDARPVDPAVAAGGPAPPGSLVAGGKEFVPAATDRFQRSDRVYFYTEVYDPALAGANAAGLTMQFRILDRKTGDVKQDSGRGSVTNFVRPGNSVVPFATVLPVARLDPGLYRLEVLAANSSAPGTVTRAVDFELGGAENPR
jgi:VWFA-related protein